MKHTFNVIAAMSGSHVNVEGAERLVEKLQKFIADEKAGVLSVEDITHGATIYSMSAVRKVVGAEDQFYVLDEHGHIQYGVSGALTAQEIVATGLYTKSPL